MTSTLDSRLDRLTFPDLRDPERIEDF